MTEEHERLTQALAAVARRQSKIYETILAGLPRAITGLPSGRLIAHIRCAVCGTKVAAVEDHDGFRCWRIGGSAWPIVLPEGGLACAEHGALDLDGIEEELVRVQFSDTRNVRVSPR